MKTSSRSAARTPKRSASRVLYLYGISPLPQSVAPVITAEGIDGEAAVEAVRCGAYLCWVSRVSKEEFADDLPGRMQNLEWLATAGLRHQRAVAAIANELTVLPARFGTVFVSEDSLADHVRERAGSLEAAFHRVIDADEWGIKIFATAKRKSASVSPVTSGSEYLKRKAELLQPAKTDWVDEQITEFISALSRIAVASSPGGKASAGQPGLLWHGSFLIRRSDRKKLDAILRKYAEAWQQSRRIDCSGPWPPYSFVGEHVH